MPLISEKHRQLSKQLYIDYPDYGNNIQTWDKYISDLVLNNAYSSILDYGCGTGRLGQVLSSMGIHIKEYDPAIEGKDGDPSEAELVCCTNVLEYVEPVFLNTVLRHLRELTKKRLFLILNTGPSMKQLANGESAHQIVRPGPWWREKLVKYFQIFMWEQRGNIVAAELVAKKHMGLIKPTGRRTMSPQIMTFLGGIRDQINACSDTFSQIKTFRMFEGIDDEPADLQGACDIIQHLDDIDFALSNLAALSKKCSFCGVKVSDLHTEWDWKRAFERRFRVGQYERVGNDLMMAGSPSVTVQGITAVGAVASEDRWTQVEAATKRITKRIPVAEEHNRTALLACYGPSLKDTIDILKREALNPNVDVISVSGSHDFLIENGIIPKYHVECDPRPHKADNINSGHPDVIYLIASVVHEVLFNKLADFDVRLWHVSTPEHLLKFMNILQEDPKYVISGGGSVGLRAIPLLYSLGYRDYAIFAMDCSFKKEGDAVQQWAGKHAGKQQDQVEVLCDQEVFISSPVLLTYATNFFETIQKALDINVRLYGDGLLQAMCKYYMKTPGAIERVDAA